MTDINAIHTQMEALLLLDPSIHQAKIVTLTPDEPDNTKYTAALALTSSADDAAIVAHARKTLRKSLPESKSLVPKSWTVLPSLPTIMPGSPIVDVAALRKRLAAPATVPIAQRIMQMVAVALRKSLDEVVPEASFKNLGGDSITAIEVMARCQEEGLMVHVLDVLNADSLAHLARLAETGEHVPEVKLASGAAMGAVPASALAAL